MAEIGFVMATPTFEQVVAEVERDTKAEIRLNTARHARIAERIVAAHAPRDTGRLAASVESRQRRLTGRFVTGFEIVAGAARDGFSYLDVTRFGHRTPVIVPKRARSLKVHAEGRDHPPIRRRFVRGYHPARDWVEVGTNQASRAILRLG